MSLEDAARLLSIHPATLPQRYVGGHVRAGATPTVRIDRSTPATAEGAWPSMLHDGHLEPLDAIVQAVDRTFRCQAVTDEPDALVVEVVRADAEAPLAGEVTLTRFSTGADYAFKDRATPFANRRARSGSAPAY